MENIDFFKTLDNSQVYKAEIVEPTNSNEQKYVKIYGVLLNDSINDNYWRVRTEDLPYLTNTIPGRPVKLQHSEDDWEVLGTFTEAFVFEHNVYITAEIRDKRAVEKFESGTWNMDNMGLSPGLQQPKKGDVVCSVCGGDPRHDCPHERGVEYDGTICYQDIINPRLKEGSLTSNPAYLSHGAGYLNNVLPIVAEFVAMVDDYIGDKKMVEKNEKLIAEKEEEINKLKAEFESFKAEIEKEKEEAEKQNDEKEKEQAEIVEEKDTEMKAMQDKVDSLTEENEKLKSELEIVINKNRQKLVSELVSDEKIVASIMSEKMTEEQFSARLEEIKMIKKLGFEAAKKDNINVEPLDASVQGATPVDGEVETEDDIYKATFGKSKDEFVAQIVNKK